MMDFVLAILSGACLLLGSFLGLSGGVGLLRFPDFYTRMHAASVTDTLAAGLILIGLMLLAGWGLVLAKLILIVLFIAMTSPTSSHALAKAARHGGLQPLASAQGEGSAATAPLKQPAEESLSGGSYHHSSH